MGFSAITHSSGSKGLKGPPVKIASCGPGRPILSISNDLLEQVGIGASVDILIGTEEDAGQLLLHPGGGFKVTNYSPVRRKINIASALSLMGLLDKNGKPVYRNAPKWEQRDEHIVIWPNEKG